MTGPNAAPAAAFVDLHSHSTASDGSCAPADVVAAAVAAGLAAIALTDHDSIAGVPEAVRTGVRLGIRVIAGVELSAHDDKGREIHLLGLHLATLTPLEEALVGLRDVRLARGEEIVRRLNALNVPLQLDAVLAEAGGGALGRPHVARALIAGGFVRDSREAFDRYLGNGRPAYVDKARLDVSDAIELVHAAGGIAVYAHPGPDGKRERLEWFQRQGLDGVEVRHPSHSPDDEARLRTLAESMGLVPSGGSDWHGAREGTRQLGCMHVTAEWLARQDAVVAGRRGAPLGA